MRRVLSTSKLTKSGSQVLLDPSEAKHLTSVLRLGPGDEIEILDGEGLRARAKLTFREKSVLAELIENPSTDPKLCSLPIHLCMSVLKGDAMEWVVEKAVELGVRTLTPVETEFTVVKIHKRGADSFQERWQRIADQALKQCGRLDRMQILAPVSFEDILQNQHPLLWLDEALSGSNGTPGEHLVEKLKTIESTKDLSLLIGPEGGFSATEKSRLLQLTGGGKHEITRAGLGALILRAETAALLGISLLVGNHYGKK